MSVFSDYMRDVVWPAKAKAVEEASIRFAGLGVDLSIRMETTFEAGTVRISFVCEPVAPGTSRRSWDEERYAISSWGPAGHA